jgi:microcystin-dependent protein
MIDTINTTIGNTTVFNTGCLTGLPTNPTKDEVLQAAVDLLCSLNATVALFPSTYVTNASLLTQVTNIVNSVIEGGSSQFNTRMVPFIAYEYYGSMSNFDSNGVGRASLNFDKIYICNGANGTPDKRGRVAVGAVRNVPGGGSLDPAVDPTNPLNPNWAVNDKAGENTHTLLTAEIPSHTHTINDPGHSHSYTGTVADGRGSDAAKTASPTTLQTSGAVTNITINATGGSQPHNNIQPTIAANYIMYIP